ncbi:hypothetical protein NLJ89_g8157 [Agrocybe chaxingu]|uniref:BTB domain-containing protein n=1 Tax=Agrocybe chaxingu TaxID=84603 RepID=A0A9W8K2A3_9AGAR|nr:hypothetical protein NLJ89_g8157 [Agrocybe chaxingu]
MKSLPFVSPNRSNCSLSSGYDAEETRASYYIDYITFAVEDTLFKVPRVGFEGRSGTPFEACASLQQLSDSKRGLDDDHPVYLQGVQIDDFENLLRIMYPNFKIQTERAVVTPPSDTEEKGVWLSVLKLTTMWAFDDLRQDAITRLSQAKLERKEKMDLARLYNIPQWLLEAYCDIVSQAGPVERTGDLADMDLETLCNLLLLRERHPSEMRLQAILDMTLPMFCYKGSMIARDFRPLSSPWAIDGQQVVPKANANMSDLVGKVFEKELAELKF